MRRMYIRFLRIRGGQEGKGALILRLRLRLGRARNRRARPLGSMNLALSLLGLESFGRHIRIERTFNAFLRLGF